MEFATWVHENMHGQQTMQDQKPYYNQNMQALYLYLYPSGTKHHSRTWQLHSIVINYIHSKKTRDDTSNSINAL